MPILYGVVARGVTVLAKHASCAGNFSEVTEQILAKIPPENGKLTYSHASYLFHYLCEDKIIYMCITDDEFERSRAFLFLQEIKKRFQTMFGPRAETALAFAFNTEFSKVLAGQMRYFSDSRPVDPVSRVQHDLDDLKGIMVKNIDNIAARGERLELLVDKTENLENTSVTFKKSSRTLAHSMFLKNIKLTIIIIVVVLVIIYFIISAACGGLGWQKCVGKG